jgi:hypothetical protein
MNARDELAAAIEAATRSINEAIALAKKLGKTEERDVLINARDVWTRAGNRACNHMGAPRGRQVVPPIVPASYSLKPMVRVRQRPVAAAPHLHVVELTPRQIMDRMAADAERQVRASRQLLEQCRREREVPDAG